MYVYVFVCVCVCVCNIEGECEGGVLMCTRACREAWRWVVSGGLISVCVCVEGAPSQLACSGPPQP